MVKLEKQHVSVSSSSYVSQHSITSGNNFSGSNSTGQMDYNSLRTFNQATGETSGVVNSYLVFNHSNNGNDAGQLLLMEKLSEFSGMFHTFTLT